MKFFSYSKIFPKVQTAVPRLLLMPGQCLQKVGKDGGGRSALPTEREFSQAREISPGVGWRLTKK